MKEYYSDVRISWGTSFQAENKEDFIIKLKEQFKDDYNIILKDDEIHNVQSAGYIFENIEISFPEKIKEKKWKWIIKIERKE